MPTRTTRKTVRFPHPFKLAGMEREAPAGCYAVETDEELLESLSFPAYRRTATYLTLPGRAVGMVSWEMIRIDPAELETVASAGREAQAGGVIIDQTLPWRRAALRKQGRR